MPHQEGKTVNKTILFLMIPALAACGAKQQNTVQAQTKPALTQAAALPAAAPAPQPSNNLTGKIAETMNAGGYTYIRIGDQWAAVPAVNVKKGDTVTIAGQMVMENFESKSLNRKFDKIVFGAISNGAAAPAAAQDGSNAMGTPAQHMNPTVDAGPINVAKAPNGHTVAEVWKMKSVMRDQPVSVRGKVVKFLPAIMGKNWLHVRDGSGSRANGDDDITVTTNESVKVGDVVTVTGTLRVDKDFGAGYVYPVIIEDAKVSQ